MSDPAAPLFEKLYIQTDLDSKVIILDNVYRFIRGTRTVRSGTYRDTGWKPGTAVIWPTDTTSGADANVASGVPVIGVPETAPTGITFTSLRHANPDEVAHIPPRFAVRRESGYLISLQDADIAAAAAPPWGAVDFTVNATTNVCTTASAHGLQTGDTGTASASTTLAAPLTAGSVYTVAKKSATEFMLLTSAGLAVDFSTTGTGTQTFVLITTSAIPADEAGYLFIPDAWNPRISTSDPRK